MGGYLDELVSGRSIWLPRQAYSDSLQKKVFDPIGMDTATLSL